MIRFESRTVFPTTENLANGEVVPMPTFPLAWTKNEGVPVPLPETTNAGLSLLVTPFKTSTDRSPQGVVVPTPTVEVEVSDPRARWLAVDEPYEIRPDSKRIKVVVAEMFWLLITRGVNGYEKDDPPETSAAQMTPPFVSVVSLPSLPRPEHPPPPRFVNVSPFMLIPDANVEVAVVVPTLSAETERPPKKVDVPIRPWEYMKPVEVALPPKRVGP